jgi:transcriptional regulator with XRE-family HTH domain
VSIGAQEPFGARLRRLREARGLKLTTLAMRVGLTEAAIRQLEIGRTREPRLADGMRLADALGADPRYLAFGEGEDPRSDVERRLAAVEQRLGLAS